IGCHSIPGYQASFPQVYRVPKIGGQSQQYIETALKDYRQGNRSHPSMVGVAKSLTDQQIAAVAAYYAARGK
ncbi:MAG: cytochrome, partial [Burkholderiaceae bacterium]|nr:cytochrome [Burkholderiaceae bacterium]